MTQRNDEILSLYEPILRCPPESLASLIAELGTGSNRHRIQWRPETPVKVSA
jgi:hypothetical protein